MDMLNYNQLISNMPIAYSLHEMLYDANGIPVDYRFLDVNTRFENFVKIRREDIVGKTCKELFPDTEQYWLDVFDNCIKSKTNLKYENYSKALDGYFEVTCFSPEPFLFVTLTVNVTEQKRVVNSLITNEERYRLTQEVGGMGSWEFCLRDKNYWNSERFRQIFGIYSTDEDIDSLIRACIVDNNLTDNALNNLIYKDIPYELDFEIIRQSDGEKRIVNSIAQKAHCVNCNEGLIRGVLTDVTERRKDQNKLLESEANFRNLFNTITDMVVIADYYGNVLHVNSEFCKKMHFSQEDVLNLKIIDLHPVELKDDVENTFKLIAEKSDEITGKPFILKNFKTRNGRIFPAKIKINYGSWNNQDAVFGLIEDISKEEEANKRFDKIFRHNTALMGIVDISTHQYVDVNDTFLKTLGYSKSEVVGKTPVDLQLVLDEDKAAFRNAGRSLLENGVLENVEIRILTKDRRVLTGLFSGQIIESNNEKFGLTVMIDVTERVYYENKLLANSLSLSKILNVSSSFINQQKKESNFDEITKVLYEISEACFVLMILFENNKAKIVSLNGKEEDLQKINEILQLNLKGHQWERIKQHSELIKNKKLTVFDSIQYFKVREPYYERLKIMEQFFDINHVSLVSIEGSNKVVGNFMFFHKRNTELLNTELIEMFSYQVGQYIERKNAENELLSKMNEMERFNKLTVDRELMMIELKKEINQMLDDQGKVPKYKIVGN